MHSIVTKIASKIPNRSNHSIVSLFSNVSNNDGNDRSTVFRRSVESKGAMKSFFNDPAHSNNSKIDASDSDASEPKPSGSSIWQRLKRDAVTRIDGDNSYGTNNQDGRGGRGGGGRGRGGRGGRGGGGRGGGRGYQNRDGQNNGFAPQGGSDASRLRHNNEHQHGHRSVEAGSGGRSGGGRGGYNPRGRGGYNPQGRGGNGNRFGGRGRGFGGRSGNNRKDYDAKSRGRTERREKDYDVTEIEYSLLNEYSYFEELFGKGGQMQTRYMDPMDTMLSEVFQESFKTKDGSVMQHNELVSSSDIAMIQGQLKPRPMSELLTHSIMPDIHSVEKGTFAYKTAAYAWEAMSKNPYYSEYQRKWMCNKIGKLVNKSFNFNADNYHIDDLVLDPSWRYNRHNAPAEELEFDQKVKMLQELEFSEKNMNKNMRKTVHDDVREKSLAYFVTPDVEQYFSSADAADAEAERLAEIERLRLEALNNVETTDWDVEAVLDEDSL